jgi:hypothetical protein
LIWGHGNEGLDTSAGHATRSSKHAAWRQAAAWRGRGRRLRLHTLRDAHMHAHAQAHAHVHAHAHATPHATRVPRAEGFPRSQAGCSTAWAWRRALAHAHEHAHAHAHAHTPRHAHAHAHPGTHAHTGGHTRTHTRTPCPTRPQEGPLAAGHAPMHALRHVHASTHMHMHMHMHASTHMHTHAARTHAHSHAHACPRRAQEVPLAAGRAAARRGRGGGLWLRGRALHRSQPHLPLVAGWVAGITPPFEDSLRRSGHFGRVAGQPRRCLAAGCGWRGWGCWRAAARRGRGRRTWLRGDHVQPRSLGGFRLKGGRLFFASFF